LVLTESVAICEQVQTDDWSTFSARSLLGACLLGQRRFGQAEPLILSGYEGMRVREAGSGSPAYRRRRLQEAAERIVGLYESWGKPELTSEWRSKLRLTTTELPGEVFAP
jgi:hypothetical protein